MNGTIVGTHIKFTFDLTAFQDEGVMKCAIGDDGYYEKPAHPFIGSESCDRYPAFINRLKNTQFLIKEVRMSEGGSFELYGNRYKYGMTKKKSLTFKNCLILQRDTMVYLYLEGGKRHDVTFYLD